MKVAIMLAGAVLFVAPLYAQNPATAAAPAVVSAPVEETLTMTGTLEKKPDKAFYIFIDGATGKRLVMSSDTKQWPAGVSAADLMEKDVTLTAVVVTKERDGKKNSFISKVISIQKAETPAAPAR